VRAAPGVKQHVPPPAREATKRLLRAWGTASAVLRPMPDFLVIGTKRGGTTSLWRYLLQHPAVLPMMPSAQDIKGTHYFYWHYHRGARWYAGHFPTTGYRRLTELRTGFPTLVGEASPYYLFDPRVPARVGSLLPDVKLVVLLRGPVAKAYSHYWERVDQGVEPLSFEDALRAENDRLAGEVERMLAEPHYYSRAHDWYSYRTRGMYLGQLQNWFGHFPRERLLLLRSEDFYRHPDRALTDVARFLGVPAVPLRVRTTYNRRPAPPLAETTRQRLADSYRQPNLDLNRLLGRDLGW